MNIEYECCRDGRIYQNQRPLIAIALPGIQKTYNDKAYTSPQLFGQFSNFRIFIKFFIYEVKKTSKF